MSEHNEQDPGQANDVANANERSAEAKKNEAEQQERINRNY